MELGSENFDTEAIKRIKTACSKYMPYINLSTFEPFRKNQGPAGGLAKIGIRVTYSVPLAQSGLKQLEIILYTAG